MRAMLFAVTLAAAAGCKSLPESPSVRTIGTAVVLTSAELGMAGPTASLYEALRALSPDVLDRDATLVGLRPVYVDGVRARDLSVLHHIPSGRVRKVVVIPADRSNARQPAYEAGAILVTTVPDMR